MAARQTETARSGNRRTPAKKTSPARTSGKNTTGKSKSPAKGRTSGKGKTSLAKGSSANKKNTAVDYRRRSGMYDELELIIALAVSILLLLSIYDLCGSAGRHISHFMFGVVGWIAYLVPYMIFFGTAFYISNRHNRVAAVKILSGIVLFVAVAAFAQMITDPGDTYLSVLDFYEDCAVYKNGGGNCGWTCVPASDPIFRRGGILPDHYCHFCRGPCFICREICLCHLVPENIPWTVVCCGQLSPPSGAFGPGQGRAASGRRAGPP